MKTQYRFPNCCSLTRRVIASLLISVVIGLLVVRTAVSADIPKPNAPEATDTKPAATISAPPVPDAEKSGSMEELLPASGEELDSGQGNDTPLVVIPPIDRPSQRYFLSSFKLPTQLTFAGVSVPMDNWQVRERIEYEFYQFLAEEGESIIMAKRSGRCFPPVEKQLAQSGLPDDLKYMLLVESKCISAAFSKAKASGPWQFIGSTGKRYKLYSNQWRDDRRNLEMSTEAAIKYLRYLKQDLGDWFLAMAAYNAGEDRIRKLLKEQRITDYWKLHYVRETMRYVPRIIAAKEIYSQPEKYLGLTKKDLYAQLETETVAVTIKEAQRHLASIAEDYGSYFLELKMLNPEIRKESLPKGTHSIRVPKQACPFRCLKQDTTP
ncbi:MAG: transglycosylase SLT domain-containing protein [Nitrospirales bacterium]|nr:transglycosylase SLT domain-containing protein [Nitrospirales bacterium]